MRAAEPTGEVLFRVTLRGGIAKTDAFALFIAPIPGEPNTHSERGFFCGPPLKRAYNEQPPTCRPGDYVLRFDGVPVGWEIPYTFARYVDFGGLSTEEAMTLHEGTLTVAPDSQLRFFVFDYSLGQLPDTVMPLPPPDSGIPLAVLVGAAALTALALRAGRRDH